MLSFISHIVRDRSFHRCIWKTQGIAALPAFGNVSDPERTYCLVLVSQSSTSCPKAESLFLICCVLCISLPQVKRTCLLQGLLPMLQTQKEGNTARQLPCLHFMFVAFSNKFQYLTTAGSPWAAKSSIVRQTLWNWTRPLARPILSPHKLID